MARRIIIVEDFDESGPIEEALNTLQNMGLKAYLASSIFATQAEISRTGTTGPLGAAPGENEQGVVKTLLLQKILLENELRRYRTLIENSGDTMYAIDFAGNITFLSDNVTKLLGYQSDELVGRNFLTIFPPDLHPQLVARLQAQLAREPQSAFTTQVLTKDGRRIPVEINGRNYYENDLPVLNIGLVRDITRRKAMEAQILKRNRELTALYSVASVLNQSLDLEELLQKSLDQMLEAIGVDTGGMILVDAAGDMKLQAGQGMTSEFGELFNPLQSDLKIIRRVMVQGEVVILEDLTTLPELNQELVKQTGYRSLVMGPLQAKDRILGGFVIAARSQYQFTAADHDLIVSIGNQVGMALQTAELYTELNAKVVELRLANTQLEEATRHKSEFLANMSHELRTPLNAIIGFSELLQDQTFGPLNDKQNRYIENILTSGKHLLALVNDVLDLAKVEAGKMELQLDRLPVQEVVNDVFAIVAPLASKKQISLASSFTGQSDSLKVTADRGRLKQVLYNLLSNAIKFTPDGGAVEVGSRVFQRGKIDWLELSVKDTGIGIKPEDQERIFEEFQMVDSTLAKRQQGTGLGLALSRRLAQLHGGNIRLESEVGKGSTFSMLMPLEPIQKTPALAELDIAPAFGSLIHQPAAPQEKVALVIEDEDNAAELLQLYMEQTGYRVVRCTTGEAAMQMARELQPSVITLDVVLPHKNGWDVLRELKEDPATREIPVLVVSMVDNYDSSFALGAVATFVKPVRKEDLVAKLNEIQRTARDKRRRQHFETHHENGEPLHALVIDDNPNDRELITMVLKAAGMEVATADNGETGWTMARQDPPDLVVLDLMMPGMDGFGVLRRLRQNLATLDIPVFVYTAKELDAAERTELRQAEAVLQKGDFSSQRLLDAVSHLGKAQG